MNFYEFLDIYELISSGTQNSSTRSKSIILRKSLFNSNSSFKKVAFDTRRINQETDYIPRRGLQNYHRSEQFVSEALNLKITAFSKLLKICDQLKIDFGKMPEWQDSYTRVLASSINKGLRTKEIDGDYSDAQPSMASLDYLEELMYVRYRLTPDSILSMSEQDLRTAILAKDEILSRKGFATTGAVITTADVSKYSYDAMMDNMLNKVLSTMAQVMASYKPQQPDDNLTNKLFDVKATKDAPEVERTVTIHIKDKLVDNLAKTGDQVIDNIKVSSEEAVEDDCITTEE